MFSKQTGCQNFNHLVFKLAIYVQFTLFLLTILGVLMHMELNFPGFLSYLNFIYPTVALDVIVATFG